MPPPHKANHLVDIIPPAHLQNHKAEVIPFARMRGMRHEFGVVEVGDKSNTVPQL
jgi:hypothetical protein